MNVQAFEIVGFIRVVKSFRPFKPINGVCAQFVESVESVIYIPMLSELVKSSTKARMMRFVDSVNNLSFVKARRILVLGKRLVSIGT